MPVAEYRARSTTTILRLAPTTLATLASFTIDDHIGCLAIIRDDEMLAANWDARIFYRLSPHGVEKRGQLENPRAARYQDMKFYQGDVLACGTEQSEGKPLAVIDQLDPRTLTLVARWLPRGELRTGGSNFAREGCAIFAGHVYLMPEDGPSTTIYRFALPAK